MLVAVVTDEVIRFLAFALAITAGLYLTWTLKLPHSTAAYDQTHQTYLWLDKR